MSRGTWYRYSKILGLNKVRTQYKKKRKRISTRAKQYLFESTTK